MTPGQKVKGWSMGWWITINFKEQEHFPIGIIEFDEHELALQVIQGLSPRLYTWHEGDLKFIMDPNFFELIFNVLTIVRILMNDPQKNLEY